MTMEGNMTPLICRLRKHVGSDHGAVWFDTGSETSDVEGYNPELLVKLPFRAIAVAYANSDQTSIGVVIATDQKDGWIKAECHGLVGGAHALPQYWFRYRADGDSSVVVSGAKTRGGTGTWTKEEEEYVQGSVLQVLQQCLESLDRGATGYVASYKDSMAQRKRIAKGKPPIGIVWNTVVIAPKEEPKPHQGGTHASPRKHQRRGHWRRTSNGRVWVRDCWVGDDTNGVVLKDYKVKGEETR
jgi:hypothetical protein